MYYEIINGRGVQLTVRKVHALMAGTLKISSSLNPVRQVRTLQTQQALNVRRLLSYMHKIV